MKYRRFGRTGWKVSEIGYGMWGMGGWTGSDDDESLQSLQRAVDLGCNFFDTAWGYGAGHSEGLLGQLVARQSGQEAVHRHQDPAQELQVAQPARVHARRLLPAGPHRGVRRKSLANAGPGRLRPDAVPYLGRQLGRR